MAQKVRMHHPTTGVMTDGFYGFSWTSFFFGGIPAIIRGDLGVGAVVLALSIAAAVLSLGLAWFVVGVIWAVIYNKRYTIRLLEKGYVFDDDEKIVAQAKARLGIK